MSARVECSHCKKVTDEYFKTKLELTPSDGRYHSGLVLYGFLCERCADAIDSNHDAMFDINATLEAMND